MTQPEQQNPMIADPVLPVTGHQNGLSDALTDAPTFGKYTLTAQGLRAEDGAIVTTLSDGTVFTIDENSKPIRFYHTWFLPVKIDGKDAVITTSLQVATVECSNTHYDLVSLDPADTMTDQYGELMGTVYASNMPQVYYAATIRQGDEMKKCYICVRGNQTLSVTKRRD